MQAALWGSPWEAGWTDGQAEETGPQDARLCRPLLLLPPIPPSITVFSNESTLCMRWPKYWSFSFSISPSNEYPGLIRMEWLDLLAFRMDWLDLLAVQGTLKSLLQHHSSKTSILQHSAFFTVQLSPSPSAGDLRELARVPLRGEGSCGGGGAPRDSAGSGATEEGLTSRPNPGTFPTGNFCTVLLSYSLMQ